MGCMNRELSEGVDGAPLREALLFTTMCIVGLPVEVHIKDGSVYSGVFHTARVEKGFDIVLKKAVMTKLGKHNQNLPQGRPIETLVVLSRDIVQVVAKGVLFQAGALGDVAGDDLDGFGGTIPSSECLGSEGKLTELKMSPVNELSTIETRNLAQNGNGHHLLPANIDENLPLRSKKGSEGKPRDLICRADSQELEKPKTDGKKSPRQAGHGMSEEKADDHKGFEVHKEDMMSKVQGPNLNDGVSLGDIPSQVQADNQCCQSSTSAEIQSPDAMSSRGLNSFTSVVDLAPEQCQSSPVTSSETVNLRNLVSNKSNKEFKLNPGAKVFSPSCANPRPATTPSPVPAVAAMNYLPNNSPMVSIDPVETDLGLNSFGPHSSLPIKFVTCANFMPENGGSGSQFNQSIVGYPGNRMQPVRQTGQYQHVQARPAYVPSNSQAGLVGQLGQIVYVHPISQGAAAAISPVSAQPLLAPQPVQFPKHQGYAAGQTMQLCTPPTFVTTGQQPFAAPNHVQLLQPPFPLNSRPIALPVPNGLMGSKFP